MSSYYEYDNQYPLDPPYIDYDTAKSINPGINMQHLPPNYERPQTSYRTAPRNQRAYSTFDGSYDRSIIPDKMSTFIMEKTIYDMNDKINKIYF